MNKNVSVKGLTISRDIIDKLVTLSKNIENRTIRNGFGGDRAIHKGIKNYETKNT